MEWTIQLAGFISAMGIIYALLKKCTNNEVKELKKSIYMVILLNFLSELEHGVKKTDLQKKLMSDMYSEYIDPKRLRGNTYVQTRWEQARADGLIN